jgi:hypothetical protein
MKNKGIMLFLIAMAAIIVTVVVVDFMSNRPEKLPENPFDYNIDDYKQIDPSLIHYRETKNMRLNFTELHGMDYEKGNLYVVGDQHLQVITVDGSLLYEQSLGDTPTCITVDSIHLFIAFTNYVVSYDKNGDRIRKWDPLGEKSVITSLGVWEEELFVADAGTRRIHRFTLDGQKISDFDGKQEEEALYGFIIPGRYFDLAFNAYGDLWVANTGLHALEHYTPEGKLREFWQKKEMVGIEAFGGCCNPAHFTFLSDGSFVTSEKGVVRIKVYKPSGEFNGVVAPPDKFQDQGQAPEVVADEQGNIYALDFDRKMIRLFKPLS